MLNDYQVELRFIVELVGAIIVVQTSMPMDEVIGVRKKKTKGGCVGKPNFCGWRGNPGAWIYNSFGQLP